MLACRIRLETAFEPPLGTRDGDIPKLQARPGGRPGTNRLVRNPRTGGSADRMGDIVDVCRAEEKGFDATSIMTGFAG